MKSSLLIALVAIFAATACKKHSTAPSAYSRPQSLVFGMFAPFCPAHVCDHFYLLHNNALYSDPQYYMLPNIGDTSLHLLPDSMYVIAKPLIDSFPAYLMDHLTDTSIGCPGCADGPTIRLWAMNDSVVHRWDINTDTTQIPVEIRRYVWQVTQVCAKLN